MKIALIEPKAPGWHIYHKFKLPRLGLPLLGALLERELGIRSVIYFQELGNMDWDDIYRSDLVGISTITNTAPEAYAIAEKIKQRADIPIIMGGPHVTFLPEEALENGADFVIRGEGEHAFLELVRTLGEGGNGFDSIPGLSYKSGDDFLHNPASPQLKRLDVLPWPDLTMIKDSHKIRIVPIMTSRGCPYNCKFCSVTKMFGRRYRFRETENVLDELEVLYNQNPRASFFFYDDNFTAHPRRTKELLQGMIDRGITPRWTAQARVDVVKDEEMIDLMRKSGCWFLYLGLESFNPRTLEIYRKKQTVEDIADAVKVLHKHHIKVHGMFVLGSDEDDIKTIRQTVRFAKGIKIDTAQFLILTPLPGTETYDELCKQGRILVTDWSKYTGHHVVFNPLKMTPWKLQKEGAIKSMRRFYSLWQCWKQGFRFRWTELILYTYAHHGIGRWLSRNKQFLKDLKQKRFRVKSGSSGISISDFDYDTTGSCP